MDTAALTAAYRSRVESRRASIRAEYDRLAGEWHAANPVEPILSFMGPIYPPPPEYPGPFPSAPEFTQTDPEFWNPITWCPGVSTGLAWDWTQNGIMGGARFSIYNLPARAEGEEVVAVAVAGMINTGQGYALQYDLTTSDGRTLQTRILARVPSSSVWDKAGSFIETAAETTAALPGLDSALLITTGGATLLLDNREEIAQQALVDFAIGAAVGAAAGVAAGTITAGTAGLLGGVAATGGAAAEKGAEEIGLITPDAPPPPPATPTSPKPPAPSTGIPIELIVGAGAVLLIVAIASK